MLVVSRSMFKRTILENPLGTADGEPARVARVSVDLHIPHPHHTGTYIIQWIDSPGLRGIPDTEAALGQATSDDLYWAGIWQQEAKLLEAMLTAMGVVVVDPGEMEAAMKRVRVDFEPAELRMVVDALDDYEYWQLTDESDRDGGYSQVPDGQDEMIDTCRALQQRLGDLVPAE